MKTFEKTTFVVLAMILLALPTRAYDFMADGIYYNITSLQESTVEVTYGESVSGTYSGDIRLNETVEFQNREFTVTKLGEKAFYYCKDLTSIEIPSTVTTAGAGVFCGCNSLTSLTIPASMVSIGNSGSGVSCFSGPSTLNNLIIEDSNNTLILSPNYNGAWGTFRSVPLTSLYLGRNIYMSTINQSVAVDDQPFSYQRQLKEIVIGELVTETPEFNGCVSLDTIIIPGNVSNISARTFKNCTNLSQVNMGEGVKYINANAFENCIAIKTITFPSTITQIGNNAFMKCNGISVVNAKMETPPTIAEDAFPGIVYLGATLRVPIGTKSLYENASGWKDFSTIEEVESFDEEDVFYQVSLQVTDGGAVSFRDSSISNTLFATNIKAGENITLSFSPNEGYNLTSVLINEDEAVSQVQNNMIIIENIQQETIIKVKFSKKESIWGDVNGDGEVSLADINTLINIILGIQ